MSAIVTSMVAAIAFGGRVKGGGTHTADVNPPPPEPKVGAIAATAVSTLPNLHVAFKIVGERVCGRVATAPTPSPSLSPPPNPHPPPTVASKCTPKTVSGSAAEVLSNRREGDKPSPTHSSLLGGSDEPSFRPCASRFALRNWGTVRKGPAIGYKAYSTCARMGV